MAIALTFDDGPGKETIPIVHILEEYDVKATFFMVGECLNGKSYDAAYLLAGYGHEIGNHTFSHINMMTEPLEAVILDVELGQGRLHGLPSLLRPPGGVYNEHVLKAVKTVTCLKLVTWTLDTEDWKSNDVTAIIERVKLAKDGDVILMHDGDRESSRLATQNALPTIIENLKRQGFQFSRLSDMIEEGVSWLR